MSDAYVTEVDGEMVLVDPVAAAVVKAVAKHNCRGTLDANAERIEHFRRRVADRGMSPADVVIVVINVDEPSGFGRELAELLMPGTDWQSFRDRGEVPIARGLAVRDGIRLALANFDADVVAALRSIEGLAVVIVDHGVAEVFPAAARCGQ